MESSGSHKGKRALLVLVVLVGVAMYFAPKQGGAPAAPSGPATSASFEMLSSYEYPMDVYDVPVPRGPNEPDPVPAPVRALSGKRVAIQGYIMPVKMEGPKIAAFLLTAFMPACCFGRAPRVNDWILVTLPKPTELPKGQHAALMNVTGVLTVNERYGKNKALIGMYSMDAEAVAPAKS